MFQQEQDAISIRYRLDYWTWPALLCDLVWSSPDFCNNNNNQMIQHQMHNIESKIVKLVCRVASSMLLMLLTVLTTITIVRHCMPSYSLAIAGFLFFTLSSYECVSSA